MVFIGSVAYLRTRALKWDWLSVASAEVGVAAQEILSAGLLSEKTGRRVKV